MVTAYISSTLADLGECRAAVHDALRRLGADVVGMDSYVAEDHPPPLEQRLADVRECDLYVGIVAWHYGFVPADSEVSMTELEYREARAAGKPILLFLLDDDAPWPRQHIDRAPEADRVEAFRTKLLHDHLCSFFTGPADLGTRVMAAVANHLNARSETTPAALSENAIDRYTSLIKATFGGLDLDALVPPTDEPIKTLLSAAFVEPSVGDNRTTAQPLFDVVAAPRNSRIVLLGDPGSGKSTSIRAILLTLAEGRPDDRLAVLGAPLPLLVSLREFAARDGDVLDYLDHHAKTDGLGFERSALEQYLAGGGRTAVFFDGLDEIFDPRRRDEVSWQIAAFAHAYPSARIIVTSRVVGYSRGVFDRADFGTFRLQDLDDGQIGAFLHRWYAMTMADRPAESATTAAQVGAAIGATPSLRELAGNPLLLTVLAIDGLHRAHPRDRWTVYDHAARVLLEDWDTNRHLGDFAGRAAFLTADDRNDLLRRLAFRMLTASAEAVISGDDLTAIFQEHLVERFDISTPEARRIASVMIDQLRERNFILWRRGTDGFGFVHRAFLEYFCALEIVHRFQRDQSWSFDDLASIYVERCADPAWWEVLRLVASTLTEQFTAELISLLGCDTNHPWPPGPFEDPPWNLAMAVWLLSDARRISADAFQGPADRVLQQLILLLEHGVSIADPDTARLIDEIILPAAQRIGATWPGRDSYRTWYRRRGVHLRWEPVSAQAARLAATLAVPEDHLGELFADVSPTAADPVSTRAAVAGLAELCRTAARAAGRWAGADRAPHVNQLVTYADGAEDTRTRIAALEALAESYADSHFTKKAIRMAVHRKDTDPAVAAAAIRLLDDRDDDALHMLLRRVMDADQGVRLAAVEALPRFDAREQWAAMLEERVRHDPSPEVLTAAAGALSRAGANVGDLLVARAGSDSDGSVRRAAVVLLAAAEGPG